MQINVKLFAFLADQLGESIRLEIRNPVKVTDLFEQIAQKDPALKETLANSRLAINQEFINDSTVTIKSNDEIAIIPPVSGG